MAAYWSYGGGIDSTAGVILTMEDERFSDLQEGLRVVFADTGAELDETLCYVRYFSGWLKRRYGLEIEIVNSRHGSLIDYCKRYQIVPSFRYRWCTNIFKLEPLKKWAKENGADMVLIGIDAGEPHRASVARLGTTPRRYPLIEANMDRADCLEYIARFGIELPMKGGCWICPYAPKQRWIDMLTRNPKQFEEACRLEETALNFSKGHYLRHKPLREWIQQAELYEGEPCSVCELL